jgi:hypothetical protein
VTTETGARLGSSLAETLVMDYEDLRRAALAGCDGSRNLGEALLMSRGMAAWMRAWADVTPAAERADRDGCGPDGPVPVTVRGEIVLILVRMALGAR